MRARVPERAAVAWTAVMVAQGIGLTVLLSLGTGTSSTAADRWTLIAILLAWGMIGWVAVIARANLPATLLAVLVAPVIATAVAALSSRYIGLGIHATLTIGSLAGIGAFLWTQLADPVARPRLLAMVTAIAGLVVLLYLIAVAVLWTGWSGLGMPLLPPPLRPGLVGGLLPISHGAADAAIVSVPIAWAFLRARGGLSRAAGAELVILGSAVIAITATRALWLGAAISVFGWILLRTQGRPERQLWLVPLMAFGLAGLVALQGRSLDEGRLSAIASAVDEFRANLATGIGPGAYGIGRLDDPADSLSSLVLPNAHNSVLNVAAELGIVGLAAWSASIVVALILARRAWTGTSDRRLIGAALFGLAALGVHAFVDLVFEIAGLSILALVAVGLVISNRTEPSIRPTDRRPVRLAAGLGLAITIAAAGGSIPIEMGIATVADVESAPLDATSFSRVEAAAAAAPDFAPILIAMVRVAERTGHRDAASDAAERLAALEPLAQHEIVAAWLSPGSRTPARLVELARRRPIDPFVVLNVLAMAGDALDRPTSIALVEDLLVAEPGFDLALGDRPTAVEAGLADARGPAIDTLLRQDRPTGAALVAGASGDRSLIAATVARLTNIGPPASAALLGLRAWIGGPGDRAALTRVAETGNRDAAWWSWLVAVRACDADAEERWRLVIRILGEERPRVPIRVGTARDVDVSDYPLRYPEWIWGIESPLRPYPSMVWTYETGRPACPA